MDNTITHSIHEAMFFTGPKPSELYGKFTWKIEDFTNLNKRELRSNVFEVGSYKWYILVYPQGCDVSNHLSLFLCVADYDKLLPGWSHFAQFTIAVVNKDPKKSKYSDTLHRFCKKEHDWGWKKFMELNKVLEGFTVNNTLLIKAQVQVIRDRPHAPFRCLDAQYRRELVRVYLTNVETICRKFVDEKKADLIKLRGDLNGFRSFLSSLDAKRRSVLAVERGDVILKAIVKRFFNEKEVTSTLVMDALFSGCKQLEDLGRQSESKKGKKEKAGAVVLAEKNVFSFIGDINSLLDRAASESISHSRDDKSADHLSLRNAQDADEYSRDYVDRDEGRLAELGRKAVEMLAVSLIFKELQVAYNEALSLKLQDQLIREEEEAERLSDERQASRLAVEREKKARKKERRRAKKQEEEAQASETKKVSCDAPSASTESNALKPTDENKSGETVVENAATSSRSAADAASTLQPSPATEPTAAASSVALEGGSGRPASGSSASQDAGQDVGTRDRSDDEGSSTSRSASEERAAITAQQYEDHIEYLKGELARAISQLNSSRAEVEESKESLRQAHSKIAALNSKLTSLESELASKGPDPTVSSSQQSCAIDCEERNRASLANPPCSSDAKVDAPISHRHTNGIDQGSSTTVGYPPGGAIAQPSKQAQGAQRPAWNGAASAHLDQEQASRSRSGQLPGLRPIQPPPPPPSEPRSNGTAMARQPSVPQPSNGAATQRTQGRVLQNGKRTSNDGPVGRPASKGSNQLNGNAPSFVPASALTNGSHVISYRNVAAGLVSTPVTTDLPEPAKPPQVAAIRALEGNGSLSQGLAGSQPATPRSVDTGTPLAPPKLPSNPGLESATSSFSPTSFTLSNSQAQAAHFSTTPTRQRPTASRGMESPGLDDFAHMGLITDLLE